MVMLTVKLKLPVILQEEQRIAIWDKQATAKPQAGPANKREEHYFIEKEEEIGRGALSRSPLERCKSPRW